MIKREHDRIDNLNKKADELLEEGEEKLEKLPSSAKDILPGDDETTQKTNSEKQIELVEEIQKTEGTSEGVENKSS